MACPKPPPRLLCGLFGKGEIALAAGEFMGNCETATSNTAIAAPKNMVAPNPAFRSCLSSALGAVTARQVGTLASSKPYKSSLSRITRADFEPNFLRWSLQQKWRSLSLRRGLIFLRQYRQPVGLALTMIQSSNQSATRLCTKAKNHVGMGVRTARD